MLRLAALTLLVVACLSARTAHAQDIKAFVCEFTGRHNGKLEPAYTRGNTGDKLSFTFAALDTKANSAQMVGNGGSSDVAMSLQKGQVQFLEFTPSGNITVTSIFIQQSGDESFPAVHSRHMKMFDAGLISQYTGVCSARR